MICAHRLAGFISAHGILSVIDGSTLTPMYAYEKESGERIMNRLKSKTFEEAVMDGKQRLEDNTEDATDAVFVFDGMISAGDRKQDALIVEIRAYFSPFSKVKIAIPYTPATTNQPFKVHKPNLLQWEDCEDFDLDECVASFLDGVESHEEAAEVWREHIDQSMDT